jgi:hypothetical protein
LGQKKELADQASWIGPASWPTTAAMAGTMAILVKQSIPQHFNGLALVMVSTPIAVVAAVLLTLILLIDSYYYSIEGHLKRNQTTDVTFGVDGKFNILLLSLLGAGVLASSSISEPGVFPVLPVAVDLKRAFT